MKGLFKNPFFYLAAGLSYIVYHEVKSVRTFRRQHVVDKTQTARANYDLCHTRYLLAESKGDVLEKLEARSDGVEALKELIKAETETIDEYKTQCMYDTYKEELDTLQNCLDEHKLALAMAEKGSIFSEE